MAAGGISQAAIARGYEQRVDTCWSLTQAAVRDWLAASQPGEQIVYARGPNLNRTAGVEAMSRAGDEGKAVLNYRRAAPGIGEWVATRRADPRRPAERPATVSEPDDAALLLAVLRRLADRNRPCPTNRTLGEMLGGISPERVSYLLRKQISERRIAVEATGRGVRIVTIVATGRRTQAPRAGGQTR